MGKICINLLALFTAQEPKMRFSTYLDAMDEAAEVIRRRRVFRSGEVFHPYFTGRFSFKLHHISQVRLVSFVPLHSMYIGSRKYTCSSTPTPQTETIIEFYIPEINVLYSACSVKLTAIVFGLCISWCVDWSLWGKVVGY